MGNHKKYWKSELELSSDSKLIDKLANNEFVEDLPVGDLLQDENSLENSNASRRDFLKYVGFSTAAATLASCEGPVNKSIPYVVQPEQIRPGISNFYATSISDGFDFANVLVKTREGRPIKIEINNQSKDNSPNARVQASVLSMYDSSRIQGPTIDDQDVSWDQFNDNVKAQLDSMKELNKRVVLLTQTFASPSNELIIKKFLKKFSNIEHVVYDAISNSQALDAFEISYGVRALPTYNFENADVIVSLSADFLGDWQGGGFSKGYAKTRVPKNGKMSKHFQLEANMSLSGANADNRIPLKPSLQNKALLKIYDYISGENSGVSVDIDLDKKLKSISNSLLKSNGKGVFITGIDDVGAQLIALKINHLIKSSVINVQKLNYTSLGDDKKVTRLVNDLSNNKIDGLIMVGVNPSYTFPKSEQFNKSLKSLDLSVSFSMNNTETAKLSKWVAATPHYLESWGDVEIKSGNYSLVQPTIKPLFDTTQFQDVLLNWSGSSNSFYDELKSNWNKNILNGSSWNQALHDGVFYQNSNSKKLSSPYTFPNINEFVNGLKSTVFDDFELTLYSKTSMGNGQQANNPWLQEMPDPITRVSWDNYMTVSKSDAQSLGLKNINDSNGALNSNFAKITISGKSLKVPVIIQPGQAEGSVGLSLGYGRTSGVKKELQTGVNAYDLYNNFINVQNVTIESVNETHEFACVQLHNTLMGRGDIIKETTLEIFNTKKSSEWNYVPSVSLNHVETLVTSPDVDIWDEFDRSVGHHFNLSIDLNGCTGCGACVISCHAENNVPVVGKTEVRKSRDMHWLRIDRYYSSAETFSGDNTTKDNISGLSDSLSVFGEMENPSENPQVAFQPVMCQHCNHAPCETVCPVAATSHGRQGQNHMAYNRCIGTRYCANNCPYKVRRFNWFLYNNNNEFDFNMNDDLGKMVLNPDVVVRSRGVMEKCSMCIQKTQKTILDAKLEGREIKDGEFQTACSSACETGAIVFGDINDEDSKVLELKEDDRMYHLLESVGTKPNVVYQVKIRNT
ncbi:TAT-variant-translocated molybdopterin oxidoreductase [Flavobacteriaceae bacterium]|jgi:molybdopterin-containing oxidoreductase family iron-sulfur binding subunit|nr:TAT-variant-translocated molybdopterin oxidoreductase [Flavobacteriaceae bacterium]MDC1456508.1 TAT-variant-translocated molybdopterin oxidoreductase [Flavobacteriaceae bacterium]|tara:strand:- start:1618 stop:4683 length:3066 start_codon:yes stop_codon:yes gene_type:complete